MQIPENLMVGHLSWNLTGQGDIQGVNAWSIIQAAGHKIDTEQMRYIFSL